MANEASQWGGSNVMFESLYDRLKAMAHRELGRSKSNTLNTTALVHELYVKLCAGSRPQFEHDSQFYVYAARAMRHILVDRAARRLSQKAGGRVEHVDIHESADTGPMVSPELALQLDAAITRLQADDERAARVVELHYFAGLTMEQIAQMLGITRRTVDRDWQYARAYLMAHMGDADPLAPR